MVLTVLKVIGIVLLVILAIIIFIVGVICLVPVRYMVDGKYEDMLNANIKVTWFPVLLKICLDVKDNKPFYTIKLLGGVIKTNTDAKVSWLGRKIFKEKEEVSEKSAQSDKPTTDKKSETGETSENVKAIEKSDLQENEKKKTKKNLSQKIADLKAKWQNLKNKLATIKDKKDQLMKVYHSKRFEVAKKDVISYIRRLWRVIKPYEGEGYIHFGLKDPATTGEIVGILAMALPLYDAFLTVRPDFEEACFDGIVKAKGKIRIGSILVIGLSVIFNKNLIKVVKKVQNIIEA